MSFDHHVILRYWPQLLEGVAITLLALALALAFAVALGLAACIGSLARAPLIHRVSRGYVHLLRVVPDVVLIFWIYFCLPPLFDLRLPALTSGVLALSLTSGAYFAEIFRAGILAVPHGQLEAALALGLPAWIRWRSVVLPQAVRRMMPAFVNHFTELLKHTSLLAGISAGELTYRAYTLGAQTFRYLEFLTCIAVAYFVIVFPLSLWARHAEVRLRRRTGQ
jgi:His/Glu/Gln/Arg/opine family amino acid ABC transporter permease subunit